MPRSNSGDHEGKVARQLAFIGAAGVVVAALIAGVFALLARGGDGSAIPTPGPPTVSPTGGPNPTQTSDPKVVLVDPGSQGVRDVAFSFDNKYLATADGNGNTYVWARPADTIASTLTAPAGGRVNAVAFSADGKLASGDSNGHVFLWSSSGHYKELTDPSSRGVNTIAFTPDSKRLAAGDANGRTYIWSLATHKIIAVLVDPGSQGVRGVAFTPNGQFLATGDANGRTYIRDVSSAGA